jgi:hypothetical protein
MTAFAVVVEPVALFSVYLFDSQHVSSRYERFQRLQIVVDIVGAASLKFRRFNIAGGGALQNFSAGVFTLLVDGQDHSWIPVTGGQSATFPVNESALAAGWRRVQIRDPFGEVSPSHFIHVGVLRVDDLVPACSNVYDWTHGPAKHKWCWVPHDAVPAHFPLKKRTRLPLTEKTPGADLYLEILVPDQWTRRISTAGEVRTTFGRQAYFFSDLIKKYPPVHLLDGPRGVGTLAMATHIEVGRATQTIDPASAPVGALYVTDPWRLMRVDDDGRIRTLVGWRHRTPPCWWGRSPPELELVGNWEGVPVKGIHECWGAAWDKHSLRVDPNAVPDANGRQRHIRNPVIYLTDPQNGRVLRVEFDGGNHSTPAKVTEFLVGLNDPWDCVENSDERELIVSERGSHRICAYDMDTGEFRRVIVLGEALASVDVNRVVIKYGTLEQRLAAPCVAPEGLARLDQWLYFAGIAQGQCRRVHLGTGELQILGSVPLDGNSRFIKIAVSDGTAGPYGAWFATTWSLAQFGYPTAHLLDGTQWYLVKNTQDSPGTGRGPYFENINYAAAVGVGNGRIVFGSASYGLRQLVKAFPTDPNIDRTKYDKGRWDLDHLLYAEGGHNVFGLPPPFGQTPELDYYLTVHGHTLDGAPAAPLTPLRLLTIEGTSTMYALQFAGTAGPETDIALVRVYIGGQLAGENAIAAGASFQVSATFTGGPGVVAVEHSFVDAAGNESARFTQDVFVPDQQAPAMPAAPLTLVSVVWAA